MDLNNPVVTVNALATNDTTPQVAGTVSDSGSGVQSVAVLVNGVSYPATVTGGTWSANVTNVLSEGFYNVQATATDVAGRTGSDGTSNELTVDLTPPTVTVNTRVTNLTKPQVSGTVAESASSVQSVTVRVNGVNYTASVTGSGWLANVTTALADGVYDVQATATNTAGGSGSDSSTNELTVDSTDPVVTVDALETSSTTPVLTGTVSGTGSDVQSVTVRVNGVDYAAAVTGGTAWSASVTAPLAFGVYNVGARAEDAAENMGSDATTGELEIIDPASLLPLPAAVRFSAWTLYD